ncbi:MAG: sodium:calcium antiporter [Lamprobacter sp.]|uniref:sodium:calcium antiporter n=1 Tax=Lamprobacter sp. TaxID=3100796 RepID=UPI002B259D75|nr:sodium:calcium antiporter [Lamprobacter sp.]MEA3642341.1 sodium:calcium antiporter [Lamprobacter sp.]
MQVFQYVLVVAVATAVVWRASGWLETSSVRLASHYRLPPVVQGGIIAALGSSFPEVASTVLSTLVHGEFELGIGVIVGSAIFNILVIPGISGQVGGRLEPHWMLVYKDAQFYITSVAVLLLTFSLAVIYRPVEGAALTGELTRPLALIPVALYGLYLFLQQQDTADHQRDEPPGTADSTVRPRREWLRLALSLVVILAGVEAMLWAVIGLGELFRTPSFLWGLTVLAAATSIPDLFVSLRAARKGEGTVSLANVLGSNIFDLLIAVPLGILIAGSATVDYAAAAPMMAALTLATIVLFAMLRTGMVLSRSECRLLIALYLGFVLWIGLETLGITSALH